MSDDDLPNLLTTALERRRHLQLRTAGVTPPRHGYGFCHEIQPLLLVPHD